MSQLPAFLVANGGVNTSFMIARVTCAALASSDEALAPGQRGQPADLADQETTSRWRPTPAAGCGRWPPTPGVLAIEWLAAYQGLDFREGRKSSAVLEQARALLRDKVALYDRDRYFAPDIEAANTLLLRAQPVRPCCRRPSCPLTRNVHRRRPLAAPRPRADAVSLGGDRYHAQDARRSRGRDLSQTTPRYRQIEDYLLERIRNGEFPVNHQIPPEEQLARDFGVSRMTANKAIRDLVHKGYLVRQAGLGTFVTDRKAESSLLKVYNIAAEVRGRGHAYSNDVIRREEVQADDKVALRLGVRLGARVFHTVLVHREDGVPIQLEDRFVNPRWAPEYLHTDFSLQTPNEVLVASCPISDVEHVVEALRCERRHRRPARHRPRHALPEHDAAHLVGRSPDQLCAPDPPGRPLQAALLAARRGRRRPRGGGDEAPAARRARRPSVEERRWDDA